MGCTLHAHIEVCSGLIIRKGTDVMEKKSISCVPLFLPREHNARAYYLENDDDFRQAVYEFCCDCQISIYNWQPYYEKDRVDYDLFLHEFSFLDDRLGIPAVRKPGWYLFQTYDYEYKSWSDNRQQMETHTDTRVTVDSIADAKTRMDIFFRQFDRLPYNVGGLLKQLENGVSILPEEQAGKCKEKIAELQALLESETKERGGQECVQE